jgi:hypothetical protein
MRVIRIEIDKKIEFAGETIPFRQGGFFRLFCGTRTFNHVPSPHQHGWDFKEREIVFAFISMNDFIQCVKYALNDDSKFSENVTRNKAVVVEYEVTPVFKDHIQVAFKWADAVKISEVPMQEMIQAFPD